METVGWKREEMVLQRWVEKSHTRCRQITPIQLQEPFPKLLKIWLQVGQSHTNLFLLLSYKAHHINSFLYLIFEIFFKVSVVSQISLKCKIYIMGCKTWGIFWLAPYVAGMWLKYYNMMHSYNSVTFSIYFGCLYILSTFWCLKVKLIQKVCALRKASLRLLEMCMAGLVFSYHMYAFQWFRLQGGWQHFLIWSIVWTVALCMYNGRIWQCCLSQRKKLRQSHSFPQQSCMPALHLFWMSLNPDGSSTLPFWSRSITDEVSSQRRA